MSGGRGGAQGVEGTAKKGSKLCRVLVSGVYTARLVQQASAQYVELDEVFVGDALKQAAGFFAGHLAWKIDGIPNDVGFPLDVQADSRSRTFALCFGEYSNAYVAQNIPSIFPEIPQSRYQLSFKPDIFDNGYETIIEGRLLLPGDQIGQLHFCGR